MSSVLIAFATLVAVAFLGYLAGRGRILRPGDEEVLSRLAFYVATPMLLFATVARADLTAIFSPVLLTNLAGVLAVVVASLACTVLVWRRDRAQATIGALAAGYVNAGNLGIPVAVYVLGDGAVVAPIILFQLLVMAPTAFAVLDGHRQGSGRRVAWWTVLTRPVRNPLTVASLLGLVVAATGFDPPEAVMRPIDLLGAAAVPVALIAYGLSLSGGRSAVTDEPGQGTVEADRSVRLGPAPDLALAVSLKTVVQPAVAYATGRWGLGLEGPALLGPTLLAALPTAQNVYVYAVHYRTGRRLARSAVLLSTLLSIPVLTLVAGLLS